MPSIAARANLLSRLFFKWLMFHAANPAAMIESSDNTVTA
ncbi:Uncharacterised protein [Vibrio cholerae]|uniref:Uncharacterized protein n=1 Tax=Vibrio cholerae TaxID=666 RepID=A0A655Z929_VIBCL|nr:Uncharacterised protein [Vibrio cholerae]CSB92009.1 Uncharacterised protein [Vibrio cholerae]CSC31973.1 Uncharacterised protein [Vibrio cholerae]CSC61853.1 Uncharacterised protein [Vibrio cholerae]